MSLISTLMVGKSGLGVYQTAIEVTGENIANVNTNGYSRQKVNLQTAPPTTHNGFPLGTGVKIASVERYYDGLLQQQLVTASSASGYDSTMLNVLRQIEPSFNELTKNGLGSAIANFFQAWQDLSTNPSGTAERQTLLSQSKVLADNFNSVNATLNAAIETQDMALSSLTDDINNTLSNIAVLNGHIRQIEQTSGNANEIKDQRDLLVRQLSEQMGVQYTENADGTTDVYVEDGSTSYYLVRGADAGSLSLSGSSPSRMVTINDVSGNTAPVDNNIYASQNGGALWATLQLRDVTIPGYLAQLDVLASDVISQVNAQHAAGYDINGAAGVNFFSGSASGTIAVAITNPDNVAAADLAATAPGGNANALAIARLQSGFSASYNTLVSQVGLDVRQAETVTIQDQAYFRQLSTLRDSYSGVSLDEELTNLVMYQRSYQASSKLITTVAEMMDVLLAMV